MNERVTESKKVLNLSKTSCGDGFTIQRHCTHLSSGQDSHGTGWRQRIVHHWDDGFFCASSEHRKLGRHTSIPADLIESFERILPYSRHYPCMVQLATFGKIIKLLMNLDKFEYSIHSEKAFEFVRTKHDLGYDPEPHMLL